MLDVDIGSLLKENLTVFSVEAASSFVQAMMLRSLEDEKRMKSVWLSASYVNSENAQCESARGGDGKKTSNETRADRKYATGLKI
jgi:hypothetical protein